MTWIKIDDDFPDHPKTRKVFRKGGSNAVLLHLAGLCYASRFLTDGFIPEDDVEELTMLRYPRKSLKVLLDTDVWAEAPGGYCIVGYLDHQRSRADIERDRESSRKRQAERRAKSQRGHGVTPPVVTHLDTDTDEIQITKPLIPSDDGRQLRQGLRANGTNPRAVAARRAHQDGLIKWADDRSDWNDDEFSLHAKSNFPNQNDLDVVLSHRSTMKPIPTDQTDTESRGVVACDVPNLRGVIRGGM